MKAMRALQRCLAGMSAACVVALGALGSFDSPAQAQDEVTLPVELQPWAALQRTLLTQATRSVPAYRPTDLGRVAEMREEVAAARARFDADIAALRGDVRAFQAQHPEVAAAQLRVLERYSSLGQRLEETRYAMIDGAIDNAVGRKIVLAAIFQETSWTMAESALSVGAYLDQSSAVAVLNRTFALNERFVSLDHGARLAVLTNDGERIVALSVSAGELAAEARNLADAILVATDIRPELQARMPAYADAMRRYSDSVEARAVSWRALTPEMLVRADPPAPPNLMDDLRLLAAADEPT